MRVRVIDARVITDTEVGTTTGEYRLITTLLDQAEAPAIRLVSRYHEKWEMEAAYYELKPTIMGAEYCGLATRQG